MAGEPTGRTPSGVPDQDQLEASSPAHVNEFLATSDGLALVKAFTRIRDVKLRRSIVLLVACYRDLNAHDLR
jgi:hypothetical protein